MKDKEILRQPIPGLGTELAAELTRVGEDYHLLLTGGTKPHIGCTVLAVPRPSLSGNGKRSSTSSVINLPGHKDEQICRYLAEQLAAQKNAVVVCTGGFHMDNLNRKQIGQIVEAAEKMCRKFTSSSV